MQSQFMETQLLVFTMLMIISQAASNYQLGIIQAVSKLMSQILTLLGLIIATG